MRKIGLIKKPDAVRAWLTHLGLWEGALAIPPAHAPPGPGKPTTWGVDVWDNRLVEFEPSAERDRLPPLGSIKPPRERYLSYTLVELDEPIPEQLETDETPTSTAPPAQRRDDGLLLVFDGDPPPPDDLPVFWTD